MGATASPPGGPKVPPGQRPGFQSVDGTWTHGPALGVYKRAAWGAESCAGTGQLRQLWRKGGGGFAAEAREEAGQTEPVIIRSKASCTFQVGAESKPPSLLLAGKSRAFSWFSVSPDFAVSSGTKEGRALRGWSL